MIGEHALAAMQAVDDTFGEPLHLYPMRQHQADPERPRASFVGIIRRRHAPTDDPAGYSVRVDAQPLTLSVDPTRHPGLVIRSGDVVERADGSTLTIVSQKSNSRERHVFVLSE